jgi:SAM-dependent methyltransferase
MLIMVSHVRYCDERSKRVVRDELIKIWPAEGLAKILDLGCRDAWWSAGLPGVTRHVGVDIWPEALDLARAKAQNGGIPYFEAVQGDALQYCEMTPSGAFDAVLAIDLLEHLSERVGHMLVKEMYRVASNLVVVWTTLGMVEQGPYDVDGRENPHEKHTWGPTQEFFGGYGWQSVAYPDWHGDRGGAILAWLSK